MYRQGLRGRRPGGRPPHGRIVVRRRPHYHIWRMCFWIHAPSMAHSLVLEKPRPQDVTSHVVCSFIVHRSSSFVDSKSMDFREFWFLVSEFWFLNCPAFSIPQTVGGTLPSGAAQGQVSAAAAAPAPAAMSAPARAAAPASGSATAFAPALVPWSGTASAPGSVLSP